MSTSYFARQAWLGGAWRQDVVLEVDSRGHWACILPDQTPPPAAQRIEAPVLPALVDAHSHAFQRAFAGLAERREQARDDFWSWRDRMYGVALRITPQQLHAVASQLYLELLRGGYTQVCEFHYLHHQPDGQPYADPLQMAWALADAAEAVGLGLTVLPALYAHAGFGQAALRPEQRRFASDADWVWSAARRLNDAGRPLLNAGVALHSLRAAHAPDIRRMQALLGDADLPIHIHISEQIQELEDCLACHGLTPLAWLERSCAPDRRWHLVHATHATRAEIAALAACGAGVVLCPGTEANLGDGLCNLPVLLEEAIPLSLGSDSQVVRSWLEELRWLEYGQRLTRRERNVSAAIGQPSTGARLFETCVRGSRGPAGLAAWGLQVGARADFLVLDPDASGLLGVPLAEQLNGLLFASQGEPIRDVYVAGRRVLADRCHPGQAAIGEAFAQAMGALWPAW